MRYSYLSFNNLRNYIFATILIVGFLAVGVGVSFAETQTLSPPPCTWVSNNVGGNYCQPNGSIAPCDNLSGTWYLQASNGYSGANYACFQNGYGAQGQACHAVTSLGGGQYTWTGLSLPHGCSYTLVLGLGDVSSLYNSQNGGYQNIQNAHDLGSYIQISDAPFAPPIPPVYMSGNYPVPSSTFAGDFSNWWTNINASSSFVASDTYELNIESMVTNVAYTNHVLDNDGFAQEGSLWNGYVGSYTALPSKNTPWYSFYAYPSSSLGLNPYFVEGDNYITEVMTMTDENGNVVVGSATSTFDFQVNEGAPLIGYPSQSTTTNIGGTASSTATNGCGDNWFNAALCWAFVAPQSSMTQFENIPSLIADRGWAVTVITPTGTNSSAGEFQPLETAIDNGVTTDTYSNLDVTVPFKIPNVPTTSFTFFSLAPLETGAGASIASFMKTLLAYMLWYDYLVWLYKRLIKRNPANPMR